MAVINDSDENDALYNYMREAGYQSAYFGYTDVEYEGDWKWVNDKKSDYTNWAEGEPNNLTGNENYAMFYYLFPDGTWNDGEYDNENVSTFVCEWDSINDIKKIEVNEDGYLSYDGHIYKVFNGSETWEQARDYCNNLGGYLAVINDSAENQILYNYIGQGNSAYFGYSDVESEGDWKWVNNKISGYTNWASGEPNNQSDTEHYAMFYWYYDDGKWNDGDFSGSPSFICEWDSKDDMKIPTAHTTSSAASALSSTVVSQTRSYSGLEPNEIYNFYAVKEDKDSGILNNDNLLYIAQEQTDENGNLTVKYSLKEQVTEPIMFVSSMSRKVLTAANAKITDLIYNGKIQYADPIITVDGNVLTEGIDYEISGEYSATDAGTYRVTVTGINEYTGSFTIEWSIKILPTSIKLSKTTLTLEMGKNSVLTAIVTPDNATDKTVSLTTSDEKVATVDENGKVTAVGVGTATITATTVNGLTATATVTVTESTPEPTSTTTAIKTLKVGTTSYTYSGTAKKPRVVVTDENGKTVAVANYTLTYTNNTNAGTAKVTVKGKGNYTGTITKTFKINAKSTSKLTAKLSATSYVYNGKAKTPTVTLKDGTKTLKKGTDYTVNYKNNTKPGKATVTIKGKGNYTGTITKTFTIKPKKATLKTVTSPKTKQLKATWAKDTTVNGYQIQYSTSSKFTSGNKTKLVSKNSTTSATITKLTKGKTYYVRVRAYKTVGKTKVFGAYSTVKKVKIK